MNSISLIVVSLIFVILVIYATGLMVGGPAKGKKWAGIAIRRMFQAIVAIVRLALLFLETFFAILVRTCRLVRTKI